MNVMNTIRKAFERDRRSQYEISRRSGIAASQISRAMRGLSEMSIANLESLADALGLEIIVRPKQRKGGK